MSGLDVAGLTLAFAATCAMVPYLRAARREPAFAVLGNGPAPQAWMTGPGAYQSFESGGVRALIDRSPMRYDVAIYCGGGS
jgi:hypothetical protein